MADTTEKCLIDSDGQFLGKGDVRGVVATESANNAAAIGALVPLLTLGVPGSETTAVMLGVLLCMNIVPAPIFITQNSAAFLGLIASMYVGKIMLLFMNLPLVGILTQERP